MHTAVCLCECPHDPQTAPSLIITTWLAYLTFSYCWSGVWRLSKWDQALGHPTVADAGAWRFNNVGAGIKRRREVFVASEVLAPGKNQSRSQGPRRGAFRCRHSSRAWGEA